MAIQFNKTDEMLRKQAKKIVKNVGVMEIGLFFSGLMNEHCSQWIGVIFSVLKQHEKKT